MTSPTDEIAALLADKPGRVVVGITGPPGAGKSTFARRLFDTVGSTAAYLPMDGFHMSNAQLDRLGRRDRKGAPDTFDVAGYATALRRVAQSYEVEDVYVPDFDRALEEPVAAGLVIPAVARLVVTEGNYLALNDSEWRGVRAAIDRLFYLDCPSDVRTRRLIERHLAGGRSLEDAVAWVNRVDEPNAALVAATEADCDRSLRTDEQA